VAESRGECVLFPLPLPVFSALTCGMHTDPMVDFIKNKAQWLPTWPEDPKERGLGV
jgi:hypothetical protein